MLKKVVLGFLMLTGLAQNSFATVKCSDFMKAHKTFTLTQVSQYNGHFKGKVTLDVVQGNKFWGKVTYHSHGNVQDTVSGEFGDDYVNFDRPCAACWNPPGPQLWELTCASDGMHGHFTEGDTFTGTISLKPYRITN